MTSTPSDASAPAPPGADRLLAKSNPQETLREHTAALMEQFQVLRSLCPDIPADWELLRLAILFHDLGKADPAFQKKVGHPHYANSPQRPSLIPHGLLSAAMMDKTFLQETLKLDKASMKILYQAVVYHHHRSMPEEAESVEAYITQHLRPAASILKREMNAIPDWPNALTPEPKLNFSKFYNDRLSPFRDGGTFYRYVWVKGLLNRIDHAASAHLPVEIRCRQSLPTQVNLLLTRLGGANPLQQYMGEHREENLAVTASTGMGKTEAALLWIGEDKGFFTLPLRVSINAIHERIRGAAGHGVNFPCAGLLHSDALSVLAENANFPDAAYLTENRQSRLLSQPLTVATVDQLFRCVFMDEGFERIMATLAYSRVVIDEIQAYSPEIAACIVMALKRISDMGGRFAIVTATFPPILKNILEENKVKLTAAVFPAAQKRHRLSLRKEQTILDGAAEMAEHCRGQKTLAICNTVGMAQQLYAALGPLPHKRLLHSRFIKNDRRRLEREIMHFSQGSEPGIWVATQVVEASLDIDFDRLYTELTTIDGLLQRMGRCFRKRELTDAAENIHVFMLKPSGKGRIIDTDILLKTEQALDAYDGVLLEEAHKMALVDQVYNKEALRDSQYYKTLREHLTFLNNLEPFTMTPEEVDKKFRDIKSYTCIPASVYSDHETEINEIAKRLPAAAMKQRIRLLEALNGYTLDVPAFLRNEIDFNSPIALPGGQTLYRVHLPYHRETGLQPARDKEDNFL